MCAGNGCEDLATCQTPVGKQDMYWEVSSWRGVSRPCVCADEGGPVSMVQGPLGRRCEGPVGEGLLDQRVPFCWIPILCQAKEKSS